jgi:hypothetical protein
MAYDEDADRLTVRAKLATLAAILFVLLGVPTAFFLWMTSVPGTSAGMITAPPTSEQAMLAARLRSHVVAIASEPHNLQHRQGLARADAYLAKQLMSYGYQVRSEDVLLPARNLEVVLEPKDADAATIVVGAHFDSFDDVPGANDNGSGVAALLELARLMKPLDRKLRQRVRFILFANEEPPFFKSGAMGSNVAAQRLLKNKERVDGMISLETMGYFSDRSGSQAYPFPLSVRYPSTGNFIAFVGDLSSRSFLRRSIASFRRHARIPSVGGAAPAFVTGIDWSDHWSFSQTGVPAFMVTDTAPFRYPHYHTAKDTPDKIDYVRLTLVVEALQPTIIDLANAKHD